MQVYELITSVQRANENAGNVISVVQFLINIYIYNIARIFTQSNFNSASVLHNLIEHANDVNKLTVQCSAVFLLFKIWKKPAKNCSIFFIGIDFLGPDPTRSKTEAGKNLQVARFANLNLNLNKKVACF